MYKYIRIDNGVYKIGINKEAKESDVSNYYYIEIDKGVRLTFDVVELKKCRLGNTIEDLCDVFVIKINNKYWIRKIFDKNDIIWRDDTQELYGSIWTDKGLYYVAKLNKKGKLELWN